MGLPWFRMDSNFAENDKIADLVDEHGTKGKAAAFVYSAAIGYANGHETNGVIRKSSLKFCHGTTADARLLVAFDLWLDDEQGWRIKNFNHRNGVGMEQQAVADELSAKRSEAGKKGAEGKWSA